MQPTTNLSSPLLRILAAAALLFSISPGLAGEVNIYTERQQVFLEPIIEGFEASSGHTVNVLYLDKGALARLKSEGEHSPADVIIVADIGKLAQLAESGVVVPVSSKMIEESIPAEARSSRGLWLGLTRRLRVLYVPKGTTDVPMNFEELSDSKWGDGICMRSGFHPYNVALVAAHLAHHGDKRTRSWVKGLSRNQARKPQGNDRAQIKGVANGDCKAAIANLYYYYKMLDSDNAEEREAAEKVEWIALTLGGRGAHSNISGISVAKHAPHPAVALELIEYMVSPEAQRIYAERNKELPIRFKGTVWDGRTGKHGRHGKHRHGPKDVVIDDLSLDEISRNRAKASKILEDEGFDG